MFTHVISYFLDLIINALVHFFGGGGVLLLVIMSSWMNLKLQADVCVCVMKEAV